MLEYADRGNLADATAAGALKQPDGSRNMVGGGAPLRARCLPSVVSAACRSLPQPDPLAHSLPPACL